MLKVTNVSKVYTNESRRVKAIEDLALSIKEGEFVAMVGPSGCGKTTFLKVIAGLISASHGEVLFDGVKIIGPGKERGMVFQGFTLFPWLTVRENIGFGLEMQKLSRKKKNEITNHYLAITGLKDFSNAYPKSLSGGMQQRVAIARTLANNPKILLMDEPFGSLDSQTRSQMQEFLTKLWETEHKTILFITHDVREAIFLADKVYVLSERPMHIKKVFTVPFSRPRKRALKRSKEFFEFEGKVELALENNPQRSS